MESIIEIITNNIMYNNEYDLVLKNEYINIINRISLIDRQIIQYKRSMDYILLYNMLNEELNFIISKQIYFNKYLNNDIKYIMNDYMNYHIKLLNDLIILSNSDNSNI